MKTELEPQDIQAIVAEVVESLRTVVTGNGDQDDDTIFDVEGLASYLKVKKQWVYDRVHNNRIPHYKMGKYPRFRKSVIDEWLKTMERASGKKPGNSVRRLLEDAA